MQARLKVLHDKANVKQVKLLPVTLIGRSTECNLKIASSQVSRNHCRITLGDDAVYVEDLGSANGTLVDGHLIPAHQPTAIAPGAHLIVGPAEFLIDYVASTSATMVLPRTGVAPIAEMPSTEMIFPDTVAQLPMPANPIPAEAPQPPTPAPVLARPAAAVATIESPAVAPIPCVAIAESIPPAAPIPVAVSAPIPAPVPVAAIVAPFVPNGTPLPVESQFVVAETASLPDTEVLEPQAAFDFGAAATVDPEIDQPTEFLFAETVADVAPPPTPVGASPKKGGLKSLFSLFGRKDKPATGATHQASASAPPSAPSVFLPAVEVQSSDVVADAPTETFSFVSPEAVVGASAADTVEIEGEQAPQTASEEDDGFQSFLSKL